MIPWILFALACGLAAVGWHKVYSMNRKRTREEKVGWERWQETGQYEARDLRVGRDLIKILSRYCGERGDNEGAGETLDRLIRERDSALAEVRELTSALETREKKMKALWLKHVKVCKDLTDARGKARRKGQPRHKNGQFAANRKAKRAP